MGREWTLTKVLDILAGALLMIAAITFVLTSKTNLVLWTITDGLVTVAAILLIFADMLFPASQIRPGGSFIYWTGILGMLLVYHLLRGNIKLAVE